MSNMRACRDTFLHYLADNLSETIHPVRFDVGVPQSNVLQNNAVNVTFNNSGFDTKQPIDQLVSIDVLNDTELNALDAVENVVTLLHQSAYAQLMDYTNANPSANPPVEPVPVGKTLVFWDTAIKFRPVHADNYFHMSALLHLKLQFQ